MGKNSGKPLIKNNSLNMNELKTFKNITIGGLRKDQLIQALKNENIQFNEYAHILFENPLFNPSNESENIQLIKVKQESLNIYKPSTFDDIVEKASLMQLRSCPLYLAAFLRLEYLEQDEGPYLTIISEKPKSDIKYPCGFYLRNIENSLWLRGYYASSDYEWPLDSEFIFIK